jgi:GcrA cell cycle regulator
MRTRTASIWSTRPDLQAALIQHWNAGLSCSAIATRLGNKITRCAVIGRISRMRQDNPDSIAYREVPQAAPKPRVRIRKPAPPKPSVTASVPLEPLQAEDGSYCTPLTAKNGLCRYPYGPSPAETIYCGRPSTGPWCDGHKRVVFQPKHPMAGKDGGSE